MPATTHPATRRLLRAARRYARHLELRLPSDASAVRLDTLCAARPGDTLARRLSYSVTGDISEADAASHIRAVLRGL